VEKNFGGLPKEYCDVESSKIVILPVPYDGTSTWLKGADKGPSAIIEASEHMELYDIDTDSEIYREGIFTDDPVMENSSPEKMIKAVKKRVLEHLKNGKFVVLIGGEHSITIGAVEAYTNLYPDLCVLQLDAHADLRDTFQGSKYNHACVMARIKEICPIVQVGIRSMDSSEKASVEKGIKEGRIFFAKDIYDSEKWIEEVIKKLSKNIYVTIDLDVFDPSLLPATGTPEPGGLGWYAVIKLLKEVVKKRNVVGFDVVELCPIDKSAAPSAFTAAKLIYSILSYKFVGDGNEKGK
jgi:agmatinase